MVRINAINILGTIYPVQAVEFMDYWVVLNRSSTSQSISWDRLSFHRSNCCSNGLRICFRGSVSRNINFSHFLIVWMEILTCPNLSSIWNDSLLKYSLLRWWLLQMSMSYILLLKILISLINFGRWLNWTGIPM